MKTAINWLDPPEDGQIVEMPEPDPGQIAAQNDQSFQQLMGMLGNTQIAGKNIG